MSDRRTFLLGAGGAFVSRLSAGQAVSANGKVRVAVIGTNGRGRDHIAGIMAQPDAEVVAIADVDTTVSARVSADFEKRYGKKLRVEQDFRKLLEDKSIDAVTIATPNHWHALMAILACQAGKDVYVEKPGAHNIYEGRKLVEAAQKYKRIVQHGVQLRSSAAVQEAVQHLRKGLIGNVYMARGLVFRWRPSIGKKGPEPVPANLNYELWTGPAQMEPFSRRIVHYNWHWTWNYGNGDVGNQGIHETDMCMWGLGVNKLPRKITGMGGKFLFDDDKETPEVLTTLFHYPEEKKLIQFEVRHWCTNDEGGATVGNIFYGSEGYMVIKGYDTYETYLGQRKEKGPTRRAGGDHYANWIKAIRSRNVEDQNGPVETAHLSSALAHLGNIAYRTGRVLEFDPLREKFINDKEADKQLTRNYRKGYAVPDKI